MADLFERVAIFDNELSLAQPVQFAGSECLDVSRLFHDARRRFLANSKRSNYIVILYFCDSMTVT